MKCRKKYKGEYRYIVCTESPETPEIGSRRILTKWEVVNRISKWWNPVLTAKYVTIKVFFITEDGIEGPAFIVN